MKGEPFPRTKIKWGSDFPADDTAAVVTIAAETGERHVIDTVYWSYDAAPTGGKLTVTNGTITLEWDITAAGPGYLPLRMADDEGFDGGVNTAVTITLTAGGAGIAGKLNVKYR